MSTLAHSSASPGAMPAAARMAAANVCRSALPTVIVSLLIGCPYAGRDRGRSSRLCYQATGTRPIDGAASERKEPVEPAIDQTARRLAVASQREVRLAGDQVELGRHLCPLEQAQRLFGRRHLVVGRMHQQ